MPRSLCTAALSTSVSRPWVCACAACWPWITAERLRSGGNLVSQWSMWARVASLSATIGSTLRAFSKLPVAFIPASTIDFAEDDVVGADHRHDVGEHVA